MAEEHLVFGHAHGAPYVESLLRESMLRDRLTTLDDEAMHGVCGCGIDRGPEGEICSMGKERKARRTNAAVVSLGRRGGGVGGPPRGTIGMPSVTRVIGALRG